jgi:hypothetical protein
LLAVDALPTAVARSPDASLSLPKDVALTPGAGALAPMAVAPTSLAVDETPTAVPSGPAAALSVPKAVELFPVAAALVPMATLAPLSPVAMASRPIATLLLLAPEEFVFVPTAVFEEFGPPLAFAEGPHATLPTDPDGFAPAVVVVGTNPPTSPRHANCASAGVSHRSELAMHRLEVNNRRAATDDALINSLPRCTHVKSTIADKSA